MSYVFEELREHGVEPIDPADAHVTLIASYDARTPVEAVGQVALDQARNKVGEYLSSLRLSGRKLTPKTNKIEPLKNSRGKVGIVLAEEEYLTILREDLAGILSEEAGIQLDPTRTFLPHIALGKKVEGYRKLRRESTVKTYRDVTPFPYVTVCGFSMSEQYYEAEEVGQSTAGPFDSRYRNVPPSVRRVGP